MVITGLGAVSPAGLGVGALWNAALAGNSLARQFTPSGSSESYPACPVPVERFGVEAHPAMRRQDRHVVLAGQAALEAWGGAGLERATMDGSRVAVVWGTSRGPLSVWDESWQDMADGRRPRPTLVPAGTLAAGAGALSVLLGARGPVECVSSACASGAHAIASAARLIALGEADVVVAGASDAVLSRVTLAQFRSAGLLATGDDQTKACRPFDRARTGTIFGEGAGAVVLESEAHAAGRGATLLARLASWGLAGDANARIDPDPTGAGLTRAITVTLDRSGLRPQDIGYANLHGTGTLANDAAEDAAMRSVFGPHLPLCGSTKGVTGHCVGATAALEAIIGVRCLMDGVIPPSANLDNPAFDLPFVLGRPTPLTRPTVISTSAGFWGLNACLVLTGA